MEEFLLRFVVVPGPLAGVTVLALDRLEVVTASWGVFAIAWLVWGALLNGISVILVDL